MPGSKRSIERLTWDKIAEYAEPWALGRGTAGNVYYVDANATGASDTNYGGNYDAPLATVNAAVTKCTAGNEDVIIVMPGHTETISAAGGVALSKEGVKLIGLGRGRARPTFTFTTSTAATLLVSGANCLIKNIVCTSTLANLATFVSATASGMTLEDCELYHTTNAGALSFVTLATTNDNFIIRNNRFYNAVDPVGTGADPGTGGIYLVDTEDVLVENCVFAGNIETACIHNKTTACKRLIIRDCYMDVELSTAKPLVLVAGATGVITRSFARVPAATDVTVAQVVGTIGTQFWLAGDAWFSNDSVAGGQLAVVGDAATS